MGSCEHKQNLHTPTICYDLLAKQVRPNEKLHCSKQIPKWPATVGQCDETYNIYRVIELLLVRNMRAQASY